jgi:hypothetical protein
MSIAALIDEKYSGTIVKRYVYELRVARRSVRDTLSS